ncbi:hypothetical protein [Wolbachia endosymbiont of Onchocerca ochengi]|uniref:hypothetical protein n=2 Tax=unclassified Wolbachia TaxID=2640676 RepID=UPI0013053CD5|nr:hypothetical protein [Wolbachia endosymbiont of Onchocerca ochengi]
MLKDACVVIFVDLVVFDFTTSEFHNNVLFENELLGGNSTQTRSSASRVNTWFV